MSRGDADYYGEATMLSRIDDRLSEIAGSLEYIVDPQRERMRLAAKIAAGLEAFPDGTTFSDTATLAKRAWDTLEALEAEQRKRAASPETVNPIGGSS